MTSIYINAFCIQIGDNAMILLSRAEEIILLVVSKLGDDAYGVTIRDQIFRDIGHYWSFGVIYKTLKKLNQKKSKQPSSILNTIPEIPKSSGATSSKKRRPFESDLKIKSLHLF